MKTTVLIALALVYTATALQEDVVPEDILVQFDVDESYEATKAELTEMRKTTSDKGCRKLADDTEQDVKDDVAAQQKVLDGMDKGEKCPTKGQTQVTATKNALATAKADKDKKDKALAKAKDVNLQWNYKYSALTEGQCALFFRSQVWINAKARVTSAQAAADKAAGAVTQADKAYEKAIADAKTAVNKCQCDVKALHKSTIESMNSSVKAQNDKTWKKAADVRCILDGTPQTKCKVSPTPVVVATTLTKATEAASCATLSFAATSCATFAKGSKGWSVTRVLSGTSWKCDTPTKVKFPLGSKATFKVKNGHSSGSTHFIMAGFANSPRVNTYKDINFGISYQASGSLNVQMSGKRMFSKVVARVNPGTVSPGEIGIAISRDGIVTFSYQGSVFYTASSKAPQGGSYYFDSNPWDKGSGLVDLKIS